MRPVVAPPRGDISYDSNAMRLLGASQLARGCGGDCVAALEAVCRFVSFERGDTVYAEDEPDDRVYIVLRGKVKIVSSPAGTHRRLLRLAGTGELFGETSVVDPGRERSAASAVVDDTTLAVVAADCFAEWMAKHPQTAARVLAVVGRQLRRASEDMADLMFLDASARIAKQLLLLSRRFGAPQSGGTLIRHDLTQMELGQLVGASRETVNKTLCNFARRGWLTMGEGQITVRRADELSRRVGR